MDSGDGGTLPAYIRHLMMAKVSKNKETKNIVELASLARSTVAHWPGIFFLNGQRQPKGFRTERQDLR